jgi:LemA protein
MFFLTVSLTLSGCGRTDPQPPTDEEVRGAIASNYKRTHPDALGVEIQVIRIGETGKGDFAAPGSQDNYWPVEFKVRGKDVSIGPVQISSDKFHGIAKIWKDKMVGWKVGDLEQLPLDANLSDPEKGINERWRELLKLYTRRSDLVAAYLAESQPNQPGIDGGTVAATKAALANIQHVSLNSQTAPTDASQLDAFERAQKHLSSVFLPLLTAMGRDAQLKNDNSTQEFQAKLEGVENRISVERVKYNTAVKEYNISVSSAEKEKPLLKL